MFLHVTKVRYVEAHVLHLEFSDGVAKEVDLAGELYGEIFEPLRDTGLFSMVALNPEIGTIHWPNGADVAPEYLYEIGRDIPKVA
jgi:hypothetical protein